MSANTTDFLLNKGTVLGRGLSPAIWGRVPVLDIIERERDGVYFYDDFSDFPLPPTLTTQIAVGKYKAYSTASGTITKETTLNSVEVAGGALQVTTTADNGSTTICQSFPSFLLSGLTTNSGAFCFECCYAANSTVTNLASVFIGLAEVEQFTLAAGVPLNASDAPTNSGAFIGFRLLEDGLGVVDTVYNDRATSFTNIGAGEGGTLVANTFVKLGMVYDPYAADPARQLRFFVNNLEVATALTKAILTGTTNLKANALGLMWATVADSAGTSFKGQMKWWAACQVFDGPF